MESNNYSQNTNSDKNKAFDLLMDEARRQKKKKEWKEKLDKIDGSDPDKKGKRRTVIWLLGLFFLFLISIGVLLLSKVNNLQEEAHQMAMKTKIYLETAPSSRGNSSISYGYKTKIEEAMNRGQFGTVIEHLQKVENDRKLDKIDKLYYSIAIIKSNTAELDKAILLLNDVLKNSTDWKAESIWFLALAQTMNKSYEKAKINLDKLGEYEYKKAEAKSLLSQIQKTE